jgi:hypothetical protein
MEGGVSKGRNQGDLPSVMGAWSRLTKHPAFSRFAPFIIGLTPLIWFGISGSELYGQDSVTLVSPLQYNFHTLIQYNYLYFAGFPVPDQSPYFYLRSVWLAFEVITGEVGISERLVLLTVAIVSVYGVFDLCGTLNEINGRNRGDFPAATILAALLFLMNPLTLSLTWWHVGNWTFFLAFSPILLSTLLINHYLDRVSLSRIGLTVAAGILLAPGLASAFSVDVGYVLLVFLAAALVRVLLDPRVRRFLVRRLAILFGLGAATVLWVELPYYLIPNAAYTSNDFVTPSNAVATFLRESQTTSALSVMRLVGFSWLYQVPTAYPWIRFLPEIAIASFIFPSILIVSALFVRRTNGLRLLVPSVVPLIVVMTGAQPPFEWLNRFLFALGGPFLIEAGGFYLVAELYLTILVASSFWIASVYSTMILTDLRALRNALGNRDGRRETNDYRAEARHRANNWKGRSNNDGPLGRTILAVLAGIAMATIWGPFLSADVYQHTGPNIDEFVVPASFSDLQNYFETGYSGPNYYVLLLPLTTFDGRVESIGGGSFTDSGGLIASYIPYPVLWANQSLVTEALNNVLVSGELEFPSQVFSALHIAYVVIDPYADLTNYQMSHSANGAILNIVSLQNSLRIALGAPTHVGQFRVYSVANATPMVSAWTDLNAVVESSFQTYLENLASIAPDNGSIDQVLASTIWCGCTIPGANSLTFGTPSSPLQNYSVTPGGSFWLVNDSGGVLAYPASAPNIAIGGANYTSLTHRLQVREVPITSADNASNITTDFTRNGSGWSNSYGSQGSLTFLKTIVGQAEVILNLTFIRLSSQNWVDVILTNGTLEVLCQIYINQGDSALDTLGLVAYSNDKAYAWKNVPLPTAFIAGRSSRLILLCNGTTASSSIQVNGVSSQPDTLFFQNATAAARNPGHNISNTPVGNVNLSSYSVALALYDPEAQISSLRVYALSPFKEVVLLSKPAGTRISNAEVVPESSGDFRIRVTASTGSPFFVILGFPFSSLWGATTTAGSSIVLSEISTATVVEVMAPSGIGSVEISVGLQFHGGLDYGLYVSWAELVTSVILVVVGRGKKRI